MWLQNSIFLIVSRKILRPGKGELEKDNVQQPLLSVPEGSCSEFLQRLQNKDCKEYPPELLTFALALSFYSNKAHKYVRKVFINALPHLTTLRKWYQSVDEEPAFTSAALSTLQMKALDASKKVIKS
ncbi:hypothetical protein AVEN_89708-1 [Araneus ventricosus]|uniref:THAP9-like helix-turn-helix domain-containing protein n=1 Tax=Araneus ventricosus TaxID=182803 RepID=A0A4Y2UQG2_ARAVE|nr:hypothetical protein AVEN_89708-1 [Araneus ventricosus]